MGCSSRYYADIDNEPGVAKMATVFSETDTFEGVCYPRFDSQPNGPRAQSMSRCKCGQLWNTHRFRDGACPNQPSVNAEQSK